MEGVRTQSAVQGKIEDKKVKTFQISKRDEAKFQKRHKTVSNRIKRDRSPQRGKTVQVEQDIEQKKVEQKTGHFTIHHTKHKGRTRKLHCFVFVLEDVVARKEAVSHDLHPQLQTRNTSKTGPGGAITANPRRIKHSYWFDQPLLDHDRSWNSRDTERGTSIQDLDMCVCVRLVDSSPVIL